MKLFSLLLISALAASILVGCSSGTSDEEKAEKALNEKAGPVAGGLAPKAVGGGVQSRGGGAGANFQ